MTFRMLLGGALLAAAAPMQAAPRCEPLLDHRVESLLGEKEDLCQYAGKVVLVVNTASYCGFTPQYKGLQSLDRQYRSKGLVILGFPSNDFGAQEPRANGEIAEFCDRTYAVKFPMFAKTSVAAGASPFFDGLARATAERPKWNFHKYLISRDGRRVASFPSKVDPASPEFTARVAELLAAR